MSWNFDIDDIRSGQFCDLKLKVAFLDGSHYKHSKTLNYLYL